MSGNVHLFGETTGVDDRRMNRHVTEKQIRIYTGQQQDLVGGVIGQGWPMGPYSSEYF